MRKDFDFNVIDVYCPRGHKFSYKKDNSGEIKGGLGGVVAGAIIGAKFGIAGGPLGAIAGTIPGAILGGIFGKDYIGKKFDRPMCPICGTKFELPKNI